jgi:protein-tyrosine sulfotransferase
MLTGESNQMLGHTGKEPMTTGTAELLDQFSHKPDSQTANSTSPIFILGIAPRSGTNYLHDLIRNHPDCDPGSAVLEEDHLVANAQLLVNYVESVSRWWKKRWGAEELQAEKDSLAEHIGRGMIAFLASQVEMRKGIAGCNGTPGRQKRFVTKTPSVKNLGLFFKLFPTGKLIVLVRDGRSVVESSVKTFDHPYGYAAREWARSARIIQDFQARNPRAPYLLVRYEDIYGNLENEMRRIFTYLDLDAEAYDYSAAASLPVRGSSTLRGQPTAYHASWVAEGVHWEPMKKPSDFNPVQRWADWSRARHERFNWLSGEYLERFGYAPKTYSGGRFLWSAWNRMLDVSQMDSLIWLGRRIRRNCQDISSVDDFLCLLRSVRRLVIEALEEDTQFGR